MLDKSETLLKQIASTLALAEQEGEERPFSEGAMGMIASNCVLRNAPEIADSVILEQVARLRNKIKAAHTSEHNDSLLHSSLRISSNLNMDAFDPDGKASTAAWVPKTPNPKSGLFPDRST